MEGTEKNQQTTKVTKAHEGEPRAESLEPRA